MMHTGLLKIPMLMSQDVNTVWLAHLAKLLTYGERVTPLNPAGATRELPAQQVAFMAEQSLITLPARKLNYRFAAAEALWMCLGRQDLAPLTRVNPHMRHFSDDGVTLAGAYGPRIREQVRYVTQELARDPLSRRAVLEIWRPNPGTTRDTPCTLTMQFLYRKGMLHNLVSMRSSDAWLGVPYDAFSFGAVTQWVAAECGMLPGAVVMTLGSAHVYERDVEAIQRVIETGPADHDDAVDVIPHFTPLHPGIELVLNQGLDVKDVEWPALHVQGGWRRLLHAVRASSSAQALNELRGLDGDNREAVSE